MKSKRFWIKRYLSVAAIVFVILLAVALLRGRGIDTALSESGLWALVTAAIFTGSRYYQASKGIPCALCKDTVEEAP